jgi:hypothetical protein
MRRSLIRNKFLGFAEPRVNEALSLNLNVRSIASMRLAHKIPYHKIGYRTVRYDFDKVFAALTRVL